MMQFLLYCFCGGVGVATDYFFFYVAVEFGLWYQFANVLGYLAGTVMSFFLNRKITFNVSDKTARRLTVFVGVAAIGFAASAIFLWLMVDVWSLDPRVAKILTLPLVVVIQFYLNRRWTFGAVS
ncbi:GtrA family protein [Parapusillimonas sp. SGNA-6]|nr:GtrA family protein [Parapusillimonas sp. SGNA-6]